MPHLSRRQVAAYAAEELIAGGSVKSLTRKLAAFLIDTRREKEATQLVADITLAVQEKAKHGYATVTSAHALSENTLKAIATTLKKELAVRTVEVDARVDIGVIGGIRIETADTTYDETVRRKLSKLRTGV